MKPKNDRQREVMRLSNKLRPITDVQRKWAIAHVFKHEAYVCKKQAWCSVCGGMFSVDMSPLSIDLISEKVTCPHCSAKLKAVNSRRRKVEENSYYTIITRSGGWQVCRHFIASKYLCAGGNPYYYFNEAVQNWVDESGREVVVARPIRPTFACYDDWNFSKPMEVRSSSTRMTYNGLDLSEKYRVGGTWVYKSKAISPKLRQRGYTGRTVGSVPQAEMMRMLLNDNEAEIWAKNGQWGLLELKYSRSWEAFLSPVSDEAKIAIRHHYHIKDATMWVDYISLLRHFNLDTHNPHYICPNDLKKEHDRLMKRKNREDARIAAEKRREDAAKWEDEYQKKKSRYFGICIIGDGITIRTIKSVAEMAEEGAEMKHCVFTAGYYKRPDALILSARDEDGNRLETIEVSLQTFRIVQARAKCNKTSARHQEIIDLVNKNMNLIKQVS